MTKLASHSSRQWFDVDRDGLAKLMERRGKAFILHELVQNAWDTDATRVDIGLKSLESSRTLATITVEDDDADGFKDLRHAFTLFAESQKKEDPEKRGRFNLGEKYVLALCEEGLIASTTGSVQFSKHGRKVSRVNRRAAGSKFSAVIRATKADVLEISLAAFRLIPPSGKVTVFNGTPIARREPLERFETTLPTEQADAEGILRRTERKCFVEVHECQPGEEPSVYEMGIPVVSTGDRWHYNVLQKVPLNSDRDNVTPAYLQRLRVEVLNRMADRLTKDDAASYWVRDGAANQDVNHDAMEKVLDLRYGEKRVIADPTDPEGTSRAVAEGYAVIHGGSMSKDEWANVHRHGVAKPAGQVTPSPKPFSPDGKPLTFLPCEDWTDDMMRVVRYATDLGAKLLNSGPVVRITREVSWPFNAAFDGSCLILNLGRLGHSFFEEGPGPDVDRLMIHEFGHTDGCSNHLSDDYHEALCKLGAALTKLALTDPEFFRRHGWRVC